MDDGRALSLRATSGGCIHAGGVRRSVRPVHCPFFPSSVGEHRRLRRPLLQPDLMIAMDDVAALDR